MRHHVPPRGLPAPLLMALLVWVLLAPGFVVPAARAQEACSADEPCILTLGPAFGYPISNQGCAYDTSAIEKYKRRFLQDLFEEGRPGFEDDPIVFGFSTWTNVFGNMEDMNDKMSLPSVEPIEQAFLAAEATDTPFIIHVGNWGCQKACDGRASATVRHLMCGDSSTCNREDYVSENWMHGPDGATGFDYYWCNRAYNFQQSFHPAAGLGGPDGLQALFERNMRHIASEIERMMTENPGWRKYLVGIVIASESHYGSNADGIPELNSYAADYHPAMLAGFRDWAQQTECATEGLSGDACLGRINTRYGTCFASLGAVEPPREPCGAPLAGCTTGTKETYCTAWKQYRRRILEDHLGLIASIFEEEGVSRGLLFGHDLSGASGGFLQGPIELPNRNPGMTAYDPAPGLFERYADCSPSGDCREWSLSEAFFSNCRREEEDGTATVASSDPECYAENLEQVFKLNARFMHVMSSGTHAEVDRTEFCLPRPSGPCRPPLLGSTLEKGIHAWGRRYERDRYRLPTADVAFDPGSGVLSGCVFDDDSKWRGPLVQPGSSGTVEGFNDDENDVSVRVAVEGGGTFEYVAEVAAEAPWCGTGTNLSHTVSGYSGQCLEVFAQDYPTDGWGDPVFRHNCDLDPSEPGPDFAFSAAPQQIVAGQSTTLSWGAVSGATRCDASGGWSGVKSLSGGSESVTPSESTTYVLRCEGPDSTTSRSVTVTVLTSGSGMGEFGSLTLTHKPVTVSLRRSYANPVVLVQPPSFNGGDPSVVRLVDVSSGSFTAFIHEAPGRDGPHTTETVSYLVLEAGHWVLEDGTRVLAGLFDTDATVSASGRRWESVVLDPPLRSTPVVLTQVQTSTDDAWVKTRQRSAAPGGFDVALEEAESGGLHGRETIGWVALEPAEGRWSGIPFAAANTPNLVTDAFFQVDFPTSIGTSPQLLASLATYNGGNAASLRYQDLSSTGTWIKVEEDTSLDAETNHIAEVVSYLALGGSGLLDASPDSSCLAPHITAQPQPRTVTAGDAVGFTVEATGSTPLSYQWLRNGTSLPGATSSGYVIASASLSDAGSYRVRVSNGCGQTLSNAATLTVEAVPVQTPFGGTASALPGRIQAENFDEGGEGVAYHDTSPGNVFGGFRTEDVDVGTIQDAEGGRMVGYVAAGEWLEYTVDVAQTGRYDIVLRAASAAGGPARFHLELDGLDVTGVRTMQDTCHWHHYVLETLSDVALTGGPGRVLKLAFETGAWNIDWIEVVPSLGRRGVVASDTFACASPGAPLSGRTTERGSRVWIANAGASLGSGNEATADAGAIGVLPFSPADFGTRKVLLEARVRPRSSNWVAVGFSKNALSGWWADGQLWVILKGSGHHKVMANGTTLALVDQTAGGFDVDAYNNVRLLYDPATRRAELWVNGELLMPPTLVPGGFVPDIRHAGWSTLGAILGDTAVDEVHLSVID